MKRRLFSLALATLLMASVLCGCGSSSSSGETAAAQTDTAGVTTGEAYGGDIGTGVSAQSKTSSETKRIYTAGMSVSRWRWSVSKTPVCSSASRSCLDLRR